MNALDMMGRGPRWMNKDLWEELVEMHSLREDYVEKCKQAQKNRIAKKDGSIKGKDLKRNADDFELFEQCRESSQRVGEFVDKKTKRITWGYRGKQCRSNSPTMPQFDLSSSYKVSGGPSKDYSCGFERSHSAGRAYSEASVDSIYAYAKVSDEKCNEPSKSIGDMRANFIKLEEESRKREEERKRMLERAIEMVWKREEMVLKMEELAREMLELVQNREVMVQKREELVRKREDEARKWVNEPGKMENQEKMVRKIIQEVGCTKCQYASGSGQREQSDFGGNI